MSIISNQLKIVSTSKRILSLPAILIVIFIANFANPLNGEDVLKKSTTKIKSTDLTSASSNKPTKVAHVSERVTQSKAYAVHDFGEVKEGKSPKHSFEFINTTEKSIKIIKKRIPCGCGGIVIPNKLLLPGEKTTFQIQLKSDRQRGKISKNFYIFTNSKEIPIIKLTLKAKIINKPSSSCITSPIITLKPLNQNESIEKKITVKNSGNLDLTINIRRVPKLIKLQTALPLKITPGNEKQIKFTLTAPEKSGKLYSKLVLTTNDRRRQFVLVMIKGEVL